MKAAPGAEGRRVVWIIADAAGLRQRRDGSALPHSEQGGGGAWMVEPANGPADPSTGRHPVRWRYAKWTESDLRHCSTWLEGINSTASIAAAIADRPDTDCVLVLDSASWVYAARKLRCHSPELVDPIELFGALLASRPDVRIYILHHLRTDIPEADGISKSDIIQPNGQSGLQLASTLLGMRGFAALTDANRIQ